MRRLALIALILLLTQPVGSQDVLPLRRRVAAAAAGGGGSPPTFSSVSAVDFDANADDPEDFTHTISTLSNGYITLHVTLNSAASTVDAVTFDGASMTKLVSITNVVNLFRTDIWGLAVGNKAAGTYTVSCNKSGAGGQFVGATCAWNGVHQTVSTGTGAADTSNSGTTATVDVSSSSSELVVDSLGSVSATTYTVGAGQTQRLNSANTDADECISSETGSATTTMSWTISASANWAICAIPLKGL